MTCRISEETLTEYLDGELDELNVLVLEAHLKECSDCRERLEELRALASELDLWAAQEPDFPLELETIGAKAYAQATGKGSVLKSFKRAQNAAWNAPFVFLEHMPGRKLATKATKAAGRTLARTTKSLVRRSYHLAVSRG